MDLKSGYPFWAIRTGLASQFPPLQQDLDCDVAIIGGGITGALVAHELAQHGHAVAVLERRDIGWGSTAASTAMLQYEIDTHLVDLARRHGQRDAALAYRSCAEAIEGFDAIAREVGGCEFRRCESLYFASRARDVGSMREEYEARGKLGLPVSWLDSNALRERFDLDAPAAILNHLGARVDPYRFAVRLLTRLQRQGVNVHDRACVSAMRATRRGVELGMSKGCGVGAGQVVVAAGYESQHWLPKRVARNRSSYALVTDPLPCERLERLACTLVWETARPYFYLRATSDGRVLCGGEDDSVDVPMRRDRSVKAKAVKLRRRLAALWPGLAGEIAFAWAGTFAETADGLPWFGPHQATGPRVLYAMAYGGNGITYSVAGAPLLRALIERRSHPLRRLYGFDRLQRL